MMYAPVLLPQAPAVSPAVLAADAALLARDGAYHVGEAYFANPADCAVQRRWQAELQVRVDAQVKCAFCGEQLRAGDTKVEVAARSEQLRTDPVYRPALMQFAFIAAVSSRRAEFVMERQYWLCRSYLIERLLPRFIHDTDEPYSADVALGLADIAIAGFFAVDKRRALT